MGFKSDRQRRGFFSSRSISKTNSSPQIIAVPKKLSNKGVTVLRQKNIGIVKVKGKTQTIRNLDLPKTKKGYIAEVGNRKGFTVLSSKTNKPLKSFDRLGGAEKYASKKFGVTELRV